LYVVVLAGPGRLPPERTVRHSATRRADTIRAAVAISAIDVMVMAEILASIETCHQWQKRHRS
jgi:hypothetical protein